MHHSVQALESYEFFADIIAVRFRLKKSGGKIYFFGDEFIQ